jgi:CRP-like cAMP-binding protein
MLTAADSMFDILYQHIISKVSLTAEEWEIITQHCIPKKVRKKQYLLQAGDKAEFSIFVTKGCLRSYSVDDAGEEHIVQFALAGWWIGDTSAFLTNEPASYHIDALEDTEVLLFEREEVDKLFDLVPMFERYMRLLLQGNYVAMHKRLVSAISTTAEEKYLRMQKQYPDIMQRVPQHMIASYLGLKPETLSRIRKKLTSEK